METSWENTRKALKDFIGGLTCNKCKKKPVNPRKFVDCGHFFCEACVGGQSQCVRCNTPVQPEQIREDHVVKGLVSDCDEIANVLQMKDLWPNGNKSNNGTSFAASNLKNIKNLNKPNNKGETRLHIACIKKRANQEEAVKALLDAGANPNTKDYTGWSPLQEVVSFGLTNICKLLLEYGAQPNMPGVQNRRPLHDAAIDNRLEEAKLLLKYSAERNVYDDFGKKPIDYCKVGSEMWNILKDESLTADATEVINLNCTLNQSVTQPNTIVLYASDLKSENKSYLQQMAWKYNFKIEPVFKPSVTHVVVEANSENIVDLSLDVMLALLRGCWLINTQWIKLKMDLNEIMNGDLELFEVSGAPNVGVPRRARENAQNPRLFTNCQFYFDVYYPYDVNDKTRLSKTALATLVSEGGGTVLKREPNPSDINENVVPIQIANEPNHSLYRCTHYIIYTPARNEQRVRYNMKHIKSLPVVWLIECIEKFALLDPVQLGLYSN